MALLYCALYIAAIGIAAHFVGNALTHCTLPADRFPYASFSWEREGRVYLGLGIRRWKDKVPDMSKLCPDMVRKAVAGMPTAQALDRQIQETCIAECIHLGLILFSLAVIWIYPGIGGWVVYGLCVLGNLPFILIQRYNRPRLLKLRRRLDEKNERPSSL